MEVVGGRKVIQLLRRLSFFMLGSIPGLRVFVFSIRRFLTVRRVRTVYFAFYARGLRRLWRRADYTSAPRTRVGAGCQMGSHPGGIKSGWDQESPAGAWFVYLLLWRIFQFFQNRMYLQNGESTPQASLTY